MIKKILIVIAFIQFTISAIAQEWIGYSATNYAGVNAVLFNPAEIVNGRYQFDLNLVGVSIGFDNNFIGLKHPGFFLSKILKDSFDFSQMENTYAYDSWDKGNTKRVARVTVSQDALGPSILIPINPNNAFAISTRFRNMANIDGGQAELSKQGIEEIHFDPLLKQTFDGSGYSVDAMGWTELNFTYAAVLPLMPDKKNHFFKMGVTLKTLQGRYAAYNYGSDITYQFENSDTLTLINSSVKYGHSENLEVKPFTFLNSGIQSWGFGGEFGFVYEFRPDFEKMQTRDESGNWVERKDMNKYKLKAGFSLMDLGAVKFKKDPDSYDFTANVYKWNLYPLSVNSIQEWDDTLNQRWPTVDPGNKESFSMNLPMTMNLFVDYNFKHNIYFNVGTSWSPVMKKNVEKLHGVTGIWITPRYENKWFGVGIPMSVGSNSHFDVGLFGYVGPLYFGSPDMIRNIIGSDVRGVRAYAGIKIPIPQPKTVEIIDRDGDGTLDPDDHCIDVPGPIDNKGCPYGDIDKDGVLDNADKCIDVAGPIENNGCPYGDKDKDGVLDNADKCIDVAGPKENNGCPYGDRDGDGVLDNADNCIDVAGPVANNGCPYADKDQDGVLDKDDACIDAPGPAENKGCPYLDTDGDGVLDKDDQCVKTPGPADNHGCPKLEQKEEEIIKRAFDNLEFDTNKDIIRSTSFPSLDELAALLKSKPSYGLRLAGHTDNVGDDAKNMQLSHDRAQAVKNYLVSKGASADAIIVEYYGETKPIATNDTPEGRQKNRRVEMSIIFN